VRSGDELDYDYDEEIRTNSIHDGPPKKPILLNPKKDLNPPKQQTPVTSKAKNQQQTNNCNLSSDLVQEIASYKNITQLIFQTVLNGTFKGRTYDDLAFFVDKFGSRLTGTANLEDAIDFMLEKMQQDQLDNVHGEEVEVPRWTRGEETATMLLPRRKEMRILGLGYTVGTPEEGITAEVLVVKNFDELHQQADKAKGKIIVFNEVFTSYGQSVQYREHGAVEAAKVGGLASLIRSVTPFSINSPHTGMQAYDKNVTQIPTACITIEDAEFLKRCQDRGWKIVIQLKMNDYMLPVSKSRNVVGEIVGRESPNQVVVVSGHIDSWDVGSGAMDDGGGAFISEEAVALLKFLKLQPRRTLRSVLWTGEELGLIGVQEYVRQHRGELDNFNAVFESDIGTFEPLGLDFSGTAGAGCIVQEVLKLLKPINATQFRSLPEVGSDIGFFIEKGVPGLSLNNKNDKYFWYHHSEGDTMTVENSDNLDLCLAVWATTSYVLSDLSVTLPRK
jgi:carboxypeptidase Q